MGKAGERATSSSRRGWSRQAFSAVAVINITAALAAVMFGLSSAQAHTTTATLFPNGQGIYTAWTNGEDQIDETGTPDCGTGESVIESTGNDRESVLISLATVPDGATITSVDVEVWHRGDSAAGGTFQTFARLNGTDTDSGTNIAAVGSSGGCGGSATQNINVADTVKAGGTALEVGVLKTAANAATVRVGAIRATVTYNRGPSAPTLVSPADAASTDDRTPTFDWNEDSVDPDDPGATATLFPNGQGFYTAWTGDEDADRRDRDSRLRYRRVGDRVDGQRSRVGPDQPRQRSRRRDHHEGRRPGVAPRRQRRGRNLPDLREAQRHRHRLGDGHRRGGRLGMAVRRPRHADHQRRRHRQGGRHGARSRRPQDGRQRGDRSRRSHPRSGQLHAPARRGRSPTTSAGRRSSRAPATGTTRRPTTSAARSSLRAPK